MLAPWRVFAVLLLTLSGCTSRVDSVDASGIQASLHIPAQALPADGTAAALVQVSVLYSSGLGVRGAQIKLTADAPDLVLTQPGPTDANGMAQGSVRCTQVRDGVVQAMLSLDGVTARAAAAASVHCVAAANAAALQLTFAGVPTPVRADGDTRMAVVVLATDRNTQAPMASQAIYITSDVAEDTIEPPSGTTDAQGRLAVGVAAVRAGMHQLVAHSGEVTAQQDVTFVAGPPAVQASTLGVSPSAVVADGNASIAVNATVRDAFANPIAQAQVSFTYDGGSVAFVPPSGVTDAQGRVATRVSSNAAQQGNVLAAVSAGGTTVQLAARAGFTQGISDAVQSSIAANPTSTQVDNTQGITLTVLARDANGRILPGSGVSVAASQGSFVFNPNGGYSDASGTFTTQVTSTVPISDTVTATIVP